MGLAIVQKMLLTTENLAIEIYTNDDGGVCFSEIDKNSDVPFWFSISKEDWKEIIRYIETETMSNV